MTDTVEKEKVQLDPEVVETVKKVSEWPVFKIAQLIKAFEAEWGVSAAAPVAIAAAAGGVPAAAAEEAKDSFTVVLATAGDKKIQVIKEIRTITGLGLKEAKDLVDGAPKTVKENVAKADAEEMKKKLETAGATVQLK